jgi:hypothetical protein
MLLPFEARTAAQLMSATRPAREALGGAVPAGVLVDMAARGAVDLSALESSDYPNLLAEVGQAILTTATPERADRLFPDRVALMAGGPGGAAGPVSFGYGAAGVLWSLAETVEVPDELVDWLVRAVEESDEFGPGLFDGASGIALALDRLGRHEAAARLWAQVEQVPLAELGTGLADGLPGVGLALLERAPVRDVEALVARATAIGAELLDRLAVEDPWSGGPGLLHGGSGTALYLLHLYGLTEDESLLMGVERALQRDLAALGLGPDGRRWSTSMVDSTVWTGTDGIVMVLHEAVKHLDVPWLDEIHRSAAVASGRRLEHVPALFRARAGALLAYQMMHSEPWTPSHERVALVRLHLGRLDLCGGRRHLHLTENVPEEQGTGAAGHLLALAGLLGSGDRRVPFFW